MAREKGLVKQEPRETRVVEPWDTFREMERMMRDFFYSTMSLLRPTRSWLSDVSGEFVPDVDLRETDQEFVLTATVPGMEKEDIDIDVTNDSITISGERKSEEEKPGERYHLREQSYGSFRVRYSLPADVRPDDVKAHYKNGILKVELPKAEAKESKKIKVQD